jgi:hypothetical protein
VGSGDDSRTLLAQSSPALLLVLIGVVDALMGDVVVNLGQMVMVPLLAATFLSARRTGLYAVAALLALAVLAVPKGAYDDDALSGQFIRMGGVAFGGVVAVVAARRRERREVKMAHVELVAAATQQALLTQVPARVGEYEVATSYTSADEDSRVGGDLYEVMDTPWGLRALIGDVKGKGLDAVGLAARVLGTFRATAASRRHGADVVDDLDRAVELAAGPEDFVTAVLVEISGGELTWWTAGHPPPLLLRDGVATALAPDVPQPPLGMAPSPLPQTVRLHAEDLLLLYTDGLVEARHPVSREFFPLEEAALRLLRRGDLADGLQELGDEVRAWTGGLSDDVAMVLLRSSPPGEERWVRRR